MSAEAQRRYRERHPEKARAATRRWQQEHPDMQREHVRKAMRRFRATHPDQEQTRNFLYRYVGISWAGATQEMRDLVIATTDLVSLNRRSGV